MTPWLEELRAEEARRRAARDEAATSDASPVHPLRFAREVARWADPDAIIIGPPDHRRAVGRHVSG